MSSNYRDWSTRKLKRKYFARLKDVWYYQKTNFTFEYKETFTLVNNYKKELTRRGWEV